MEIDWKDYRVVNGEKFKIKKYSTSAPFKTPDKEELKKRLIEDITEIASLQDKLYAESRQSLLIVLQGMDSAGKDSLIKHIMSGVNPQGVDVNSFKHPSDVELEHDYLWRHVRKLPEKGHIGIFNRSHYENVLISKVHPEIVLAERIKGIDAVHKVDKKFWEKRYRQIVTFEKTILQNDITTVKIFLHLSKEEQRQRFLARIENKRKHWKFSPSDIAERKCWTDYQKAYEEAIRRTSTRFAPWYVVPADDKWFTQLLCGKIVMHTLKKMNPNFPPVDRGEAKLMSQAKAKLLHE